MVEQEKPSKNSKARQTQGYAQAFKLFERLKLKED